jgi:hypothetical protein
MYCNFLNDWADDESKAQVFNKRMDYKTKGMFVP